MARAQRIRVSARADEIDPIRLRPHRYHRLVVGPRSWRPLRIVGTRGVRVGTLRLDGTQRVSFGRVTVAPVAGDAGIEVWRSRHVTLHDLVVTTHVVKA